MPTYKGNKGNLLQHWVLCELLSAAREHVSRLQFIDAHAMAPVAEKQEDKHKDSVFDSVRARLPGQGSSYERAWKELVPHGETGYPNSASFVKRLWNGSVSMLLCENDENTVQELTAWADSTSTVEIASCDWRRRFEDGLPESGELTVLSFDPYMLSCHIRPQRERDPGYMYPEDLDRIGRAIQKRRTGLLIQLSTYSANGPNSQRDVEQCALEKLKPFELERIAKVTANGQMMSLVFARGARDARGRVEAHQGWGDDLTSLNERFQNWLNPPAAVPPCVRRRT